MYLVDFESYPPLFNDFSLFPFDDQNCVCIGFHTLQSIKSVFVIGASYSSESTGVQGSNMVERFDL